MGIREEILPYVDGNGLITPSPAIPGQQRGSDNGTLYYSEMVAILNKSDELTDQDRALFAQRIGACIDSNGLLNRAPVGTDPDLESVDNYYGTINGSFQTQNTNIPRKYLKAVWKYWGFLNNAVPGTKNWQSFLIRQPQLLCAMITAAYPLWFNPLHVIIRSLVAPLYWYSAVVILFGAKAKPVNDSTSRILGWHLLSVVENYSLACKFASWIWMNRLHSNYGNPGMQKVADIFFQPTHPLAKYWID